MQIIADSCCDLNKEIEDLTNIKIVPLTINIDGIEYKDDKDLDTNELLKKMKASKSVPKTANPSPQAYMDAYKGDESVFVVTLSSQLSGSYNSAMIAKKMFLENANDKFIHVFDSLSASIGETLVSMKVFELGKKNLDDIEIVKKVNEYINEMKTFFVLESLENLIKAGRMSKLKGKLASVLSIKPIMRGTDKGAIELVKKVRGSKRALRKLVDVIGEKGDRLEEKILGIAHCNCLDRALKLKEEVNEKYNFKDIIIVDTAGISTVYANDGGIVIAF